jgi:hypothetical protein
MSVIAAHGRRGFGDFVTPEHRERATARSLALRQQKARWRRDLRSGVITLQQVYDAMPEELARVRLFELLEWCRYMSSEKMIAVGREAVRDGINLMVPLGRSSERSRRWTLARRPSPGFPATDMVQRNP